MHPIEAAARMLANGGPPEVVERTELQSASSGNFGITAVSTIDTEEGYGYETAVFVLATWHPVERYKTRAEAVTGHARWVEQSSTLTEIIDIGLPLAGFDQKTLIRF